MKFISNNITLNIAITISVLAHAALLAVRFTDPDAFRFKPTDPGLEVVLVNAKHDKKPLKADALAQANLDGGGNADAGLAKSPLPDLGKVEDGDSLVVAKKRVVEWEKQQQKMLAQFSKKTDLSTPLVTSLEKLKEDQQPSDGTDILESVKVLKRSEAVIFKRMEDENKRPKKTYISPSTKEVRYAMYYDSMRNRIETIGTLNFPHKKNGQALRGKLTMSISVSQDGTIYKGEGEDGIAVDVSSGNAELDAAAKRIARRAAPFGRIPANMRSSQKDEVFVMITTFNFTDEDTLEAEMRGAKN